MKTNSIIIIVEYFVKSFLILWIIRKLRVIPHILFDIQYIQLYFRPAFTKQNSCNSSIYWWSLQINLQFLCSAVGSFYILKGLTSKLSKRFCFQPYCSWILFHFRITICMCCMCTFLRLFLYGCLRHQYYIIPSPTFSTHKIYIISLQFYKRT